METAIADVAEDKPAGDVVGMRHRPVYGTDDGDRLAAIATQLGRAGAEVCDRVGILGCDGLRQATGQGQGGRCQKLTARTTKPAVEHAISRRFAEQGRTSYL